MPDPDCVFCRIVSGDLPGEIIHEDDLSVAFRDVNPQAPVHVLVVPRRHVESVEALTDEDRDLVGHLLLVARRVAREEGLSDEGYRLVANVGDRGGQTVDHLHLHLLGGRRLTWPPG